MKLTPGGAALPDADVTAERATEDERWLRCAACGARITPERARIDVDGSHEHTFMNPSGLHFRVACFAAAPGCAAEGEPSTVWTWFPGRAWQIALCRACGAHVGWSFQREEGAGFHGLIADRLTSR